jgi:hypothetical protein|tara:strand:+ start:897 stop:1457 length:561 start_codon:yes stop_codon:yes gene_type:complete
VKINKEIYKEQYLFEHDRKQFYDKLIQYPTTLLIVFIGSSLYCFNKYFPDGIKELSTKLDWAFTVSFILFSISVICTIWFLGIVFHGFTRKYDYLPNTEILFKYEIDLYKYYYKISKIENYQEKRISAQQKTCEEFEKVLKTYYKNITSQNQKINDHRAESYYFTRTFLFIDLVFLVIIGSIGILN